MWAKAEEALSMFQTTIRALDVIRSFFPVPASQAADALVAVEAIIEALAKGFAGTLKAADVDASIKTLRDGIKFNDQAADDALDKKFG